MSPHRNKEQATKASQPKQANQREPSNCTPKTVIPLLDKTGIKHSPVIPNPSDLLQQLRKPVLAGITRSKAWRQQQLQGLEALITSHQDDVLAALATDLGKPPTEALFELIILRTELKLAKRQLNRWMQPRRVAVPLAHQPGKAKVLLEPLGCILIIGPWNYPFSLTLQPLISALAAGNTAVLKPSEQAPATSQLIARLIPQHLSSDVVRVIEGDGEMAAALTHHPFDHIFFTGSGAIGKKVMAAAAEHLTPVTLELGGKSPAIVLEGADLAVTARRLMWGKGLNAGQACIAPDHLLVESQLKAPLLQAMKRCLVDFYGPNPLQSPHLATIVNDKQFQRLSQLLEGARQRSQILFGGEIDASQRRIAPTLIDVDQRNDPLMAEELFGPLLPILSITSLDEALTDIRRQPRPLAIYLFGGTADDQDKLLKTTSSGGVCFNDVMMQVGIPELPFGGVGPSGMGSYHGLAGFETFSHQKSILQRPFWLDIKVRYPPYANNLEIIKRLMS